MIPIGFLAASGAGAKPAYELLATTALTSNASVVTFSSITGLYGNDYKHLQVRYSARNSLSAAGAGQITMRFMNVSSSDYSQSRMMLADGPRTDGLENASSMYVGQLPYNNSAPGWGVGTVDIANAFSSNYKTLKYFAGCYAYGNGSENTVAFGHGNWRSTTIVDQLSLRTDNGQFTANSRFSLYGIRGD